MSYVWPEVSENWVLILGIVAAYVALWFHWRRTETDRRRLANETYVKAIELLNSDEIGIRVGAVYALERIAIENDRYHWQIMETFCANIRERMPWAISDEIEDLDEGGFVIDPKTGNVVNYPPTDIQAILTVIGRRNKKHQGLEKTLDLSRIDLRYADLEGGAFDGALFNDCNLKKAKLPRVHLEGADLSNVRLEGAILFTAHLEGAILFGANLKGAVLDGAYLESADLTGAHLEEAHLEGADLSGAHLEGADLSGAHLEGADLSGAHLEGADLSGAHLEGADLSGAHLEGADLSGAFLEGSRFHENPRDLGAIWNEGRPPRDLDKIVIETNH